MAETAINNPASFYTHFLYKAIFISIFLLLLPLFPSQAPDSISHKTINTTGWELLQLVFVGIAVSYGLFSKRNDETRKDDKAHTWNSQYYREEPVVVVAKESDEATTIEKPLLLPVRSLKNRVSESPMIDSKRISRNLSQLSPDSEENIVLRSPIPWRSRSGRMEVKEEFCRTPGVHDSSEINPIDSPSFRYQSRSSELQSKAREDVGRRNITQKSSFSPVPPPPPPPPPRRPVNVNNTHNRINTYASKLNRNVTSVPEDLQNRGRRGAEFTIRTRSDTSSASKSFRRRSQSKKLMDEETQTYPKEELIESRKDSEDETEKGETGASDSGPDVDKKADEFIAKFREQIRLQRIASIRRSTAQTPQNGPRFLS